jgi:sortase A
MDRRKLFAGICITAGIVILAVPFYWRLDGARKTNQLMTEFEQTIESLEEEGSEEEESTGQEEQTGISEADAALLSEGDVIGIIEIKSIGIRYPVIEGTGASALNAGIGHITETAGIGEKGNCVLCGHNGSRRGTFFTPLSQAAIGDEVTILDKNGETHIYEITDSFVVNPYDNSIKTQTGEEELTLFTCAQKGTMRYVVKCVPKEAADE